MKMFRNGQWRSSRETIEVVNPFDGAAIDEVPSGSTDDIHQAVDGLVLGAQTIRQLPSWKRAEILERAAQRIQSQRQTLAQQISEEEGKPIRESLAEVERSAATLSLASHQARQIFGEVIPLDATPGGENKLGFTMRIPCGIVAAITPFNFPLNLVCHKVGPAIAAGNAVLLKPASDTPLSALSLVEILLESGLPIDAIACVTGSGSKLGKAICNDERIRKISFTGSPEVGKQICAWAGLKRITMELGANCPLIVLSDANLSTAANAVVSNGFANAGQVCISAQRIITLPDIHESLVEQIHSGIENISVGNQLDDSIQMGPMIRESDARRVESWIAEAESAGARILCGGQRDAAIFQPTLIDNASVEMRVVQQELFGPAVAILKAENIDQAIHWANNSQFGLSAAVYTQDISQAMRFAREIDSGNIHINGGPQYRADAMPYGGLKDSGMGKEGPKYAIDDMTETKMIVIHN